VSVINYVSVLLKQIAEHSSNLRAFITVDHEAVMAAARAADARCKQAEPLGSLFGIPISLKGLIITAGTTTTFGTEKFSNFVPASNASLVDRLLAEDAIIFGKNNLQLNPYDKTRIAGGAAALAR
jgi:aspartyl-tRNA(Asn)/glutamyl-tRNA(Gln) amidotransferase subunit A|tara:strand:+ start:167 stop:541 length:375 start_codon:yes stop_codon:yes gene_type:complete